MILSKGTEESRGEVTPWGKRPRKWAKLAFFGDDPAEASKPAKPQAPSPRGIEGP